MTTPEDDRFCPECGVDLGLHGTESPSADGSDCEIAVRKADLLTAFSLTYCGIYTKPLAADAALDRLLALWGQPDTEGQP